VRSFVELAGPSRARAKPINMPDEKITAKQADQNATSLAESLLGACAQVGNTNPLHRPITGKFRVEGRVTREDGTGVSGITLGLFGAESSRTDADGRFVLTVEKK
jgi:hypothetical protein